MDSRPSHLHLAPPFLYLQVMAANASTRAARDSVLLGSHMPISGGIHLAFERAASIGCTTMQVFTKNSNQWTGKPLTANDIETYKSSAAKARISPVVAHAAYLINLCARNPVTLKRSRRALLDELRRCEALSIQALIVHPGAHVGWSETDGIRKIAESINIIHDQTDGYRVLTTLETTAGQGTSLGYRFEHLRDIMDSVDAKDRMAVCVDTCHLFAAGYEIHTEQGWGDTMRRFDDIVGLERLAAIHLNDSKKPFRSRIDRHEHIGKGMIGLTAFRKVMNDERLVRIPKILETDKSADLHEDRENMALLRSLVAPSTAVG